MHSRVTHVLKIPCFVILKKYVLLPFLQVSNFNFFFVIFAILMCVFFYYSLVFGIYPHFIKEFCSVSDTSVCLKMHFSQIPSWIYGNLFVCFWLPHCCCSFSKSNTKVPYKYKKHMLGFLICGCLRVFQRLTFFLRLGYF